MDGMKPSQPKGRSLSEREDKELVVVMDEESLSRCMWGRLHILLGMKLLIAVGVAAITAILVLESIYFRRAIFVLLVPTVVTACTVIAMVRQSRQFVWPIIGISFFHMFLALYATLIFMYYFFFKPLYIIMVLNWAFDTLYTSKTLSYYLHCLCMFTALTAFFLFNLWQLRVSLRFRDFIEESAGSAPTSSTISNSSSARLNLGGGGRRLSPPPLMMMSKMLNEPPIVVVTNQHQQMQQQSRCPSRLGMLANGVNVGSGAVPYYCDLNNQSRRSSLTEGRRFAT